MHIIDGGLSSPLLGEPTAREMSKARVLWERVKLEVWHWRLRRWLPRLVWIDDEIDVRITFSEHTMNPDDPLGSLFGGHMVEIEKAMSAAGIGFDKGCGFAGRDWEWDWSLRGPISVKFKSRASNPERRVRPPAPPKPKLVA